MADKRFSSPLGKGNLVFTENNHLNPETLLEQMFSANAPFNNAPPGFPGSAFTKNDTMIPIPINDPKGMLQPFIKREICERFRTQLKGSLHDFLDYLKNDPYGIKFMKKSSYRARLVAYYFYFLCMNNHPTIEPFINDILSHCKFNYEQEVMTDKWYVPTTGSFQIDVRLNAIARYIYKNNVNVALDLLEAVGECLSTMAAASLSSAFTISAMIPDTEMEFEDFLMIFEDEKFSPPQKSNARALDPKVFACIIGTGANVPGWQDTMRINPILFHGENQTISYCPGIGAIDTRMCFSKDAFAGIKVNEIIPDDVVDTDEIQLNLGPLDQYMQSIMAMHVFLSRLYQQERRDYEQEWKRIKNQKKELKQRDDELARLRAENEKLKAKLQTAHETAAKKAVPDDSATKQIQKLENYTKHLEDKLAKEKQKVKDAHFDVAEERRNTAALKEEILVLQEQLNTFESDSLEENEPLDTSIFNNLRIVSFGGHRTWEQGMRNLHENITFFDEEAAIDDKVIEKADAVWIQANGISHSKFYKVTQKARICNVPIKYFKYAGHRACCRQMIRDTEEMFPRSKQ